MAKVAGASEANMLRLFLAFALCCAVGGGSAYAADLSCPTWARDCSDGSVKGTLFIGGEIRKGDGSAVEAELRRRGPTVSLVFLWGSPGGDLTEAMAIGRLVRRLKLNTAIAEYGGGFITSIFRISRDDAPDAIRNSTCASACVFIWAAGIERQGNYRLVVHRPYYDPSYFAGLTADEANERYQSLEVDAHTYLQQMGMPDFLWGRMLITPSDKGEEIAPEMIGSVLSAQDAAYSEWLMAKCGTVDEDAFNAADYKRYQKLVLSQDEQHLIDKYFQHMTCVNVARYLARKDAWSKVFPGEGYVDPPGLEKFIKPEQNAGGYVENYWFRWITSVAGLLGGWWLLNFVGRPILEFRKVRSKVLSIAASHSHVSLNASQAEMTESRRALSVAAADLKATKASVASRLYAKLCRYEIELAVGFLIALHNNVGALHGSDQTRQDTLDALRACLGAPSTLSLSNVRAALKEA